MAQHPITGVEIAGYGLALPDLTVTNDELISQYGLDSTDEWLRQKVGIIERHFAGSEDRPSRKLSALAARSALKSAGLELPCDFSTIRAGTWTSDLQTPGTANAVHNELGAAEGGAVDQNAACASFVYALLDAYREFPPDDDVERVMVIGADILSKKTDFSERSGLLFGDGAGAFLLQRNNDRPEAGLMAWHTTTKSQLIPALYAGRGEAEHIVMDGQEVLRNAVPLGVELGKIVMQKAYEDADIKPDDIGLVVMHQANIRIINAIARGLKLPTEKVAISIGRHANTSSASIPMAFAEAADAGMVKRGDNVMLLGFGAGLTVAGAIIRY